METSQLKIIEEIKELVSSKGYIYALLMILFEDFHINIEKSHEIDNRSRLSSKESLFLLGFLIQNELDLSVPESPKHLIEMKKKTYVLMENLHKSFTETFFKKLKETLVDKEENKDPHKAQKDFFGKGNMLTEPIFYSGTGAYDIQYLEFLEKKYKYDQEWLYKNANFDIEKTQEIVCKIKEILHEKSKKVNLHRPKEKLPGVIEKLKDQYPNEDLEKDAEDIIPMIEIHQYVKLFFDHVDESKPYSPEEGWESFYKGLIELFTITKNDFDENLNINDFLKNFSLLPVKGLNSNLKGIGDFNLITARPIIELNEEKYLVPISFALFEALYESPFYWMTKDEKYLDQLAKNRGNVGEEISFDFLVKVFGEKNTFKSVRILNKKGEIATDIDVLCVLGSKALCVQVKSQKLTELSRKGNDEALNKDFQRAVQEAYDQGMISRSKILERGAKFLDVQGNEIFLSEEIDDVYLMVVTTENYPSLTHQAHVMLNKIDTDPFPLALTIFDLEIVAHYLNDPFDFLYYVRQRTSLIEYFKADEEVVLLGFHLDQKLWKIGKTDGVAIDNSFGQLIDRNYYPLIAKIEVSDEGDKIKNRWKSEDFEKLCDRLKSLDKAKITDIIFHLLDWSGEARKNLVKFIISRKKATLLDDKNHDFSMPPEDKDLYGVGISYISSNSNDIDELSQKLLLLCKARKYKSKTNAWIGFGSLKDSKEIIDTVIFSDQPWQQDDKLEKLSEGLLDKQSTFIRLGKKIGRNDKCSCGSNLKYKKCCGF